MLTWNEEGRVKNRCEMNGCFWLVSNLIVRQRYDQVIERATWNSDVLCSFGIYTSFHINPVVLFLCRALLYLSIIKYYNLVRSWELSELSILRPDDFVTKLCLASYWDDLPLESRMCTNASYCPILHEKIFTTIAHATGPNFSNERQLS